MNTAWTYTVDDEHIAWLTFDLPGERVNKFTTSAMRDLATVLERAAADRSIKAAVIVSGKPGCFVVGADIDELARIADEAEAETKAMEGQAVFAALEALEVPTVAVIDGACLGGGLELALACRYRLVTDGPKTSLGLPEVGLGIIPGWGGTQRLPRVVGLARALNMILTGRPVNGRRAVRCGLADGTVASAFTREHARRFVDGVLESDGARDVVRRRRTRRSRAMRMLEATAAGRAVIARKARAQVMEKTRGNYPAPLAALDVIVRTFGKTRVDGFAEERRVFSELCVTSISRNLVWIFQAGQRMKKGAKAAGAKAPSVESSAVVGAGIMGRGIAWALAHAGRPVRLKDIDYGALERAMGAIADVNRGLVKRRKLTDGGLNQAMHRVTPCVDYRGFESVDVVIEAVIENIDLKKKVLREIEDAVGPDTIICTNTSSLPLRELAATLDNPRRFVGLHFFNPVHRMPLVEVIPGPKTSKATLVATAEMVRGLGKTPIIVGDCAGFLVNRILLPYLIESAWMFEEGAGTRRIDDLLERFGMPMGPLALVDEVGLDVGYEVAKVLEGAYGDRMNVPSALNVLAKTGTLLGRKNGQGFYTYGKGGRKPNPEVVALGVQGRLEDGIGARELTDEAIVDRAVLIMVNEAARCLEERVVEDPAALDMAMIMGTGFAPFRGGLLRYADARGIKVIKDRLDELAEVYGDRFRPAPLIERLAAGESGFHGDRAA
jgi:3-hydroxyacyl-CoA dehydrogenase/enoyl-CoA hydratase/3-hydroxybutyryl-CoA epimerase